MKHSASRNLSTARLLAAGVPALLLPLTATGQIEEITVTARKVEERLQDVPIAVEAFSADIIQRRGLRSVADVTRQSASLVFDQGAVVSDTRITIRGLSPSRGRQNAALLVDGIDVSSEAVTSSGGSTILNQRLLDVERIEVVKGPQIALWGRSAFNGAIQYVTKAPSDEFEAELHTDLNLESQYSLRGSVSGPIFGDALGVRINAAWWDEDGFHRNTTTGAKLGGDQGYGFSLSTRSELGRGLTIRSRAEYTRSETQPSAEAFIPFNTLMQAPPEAFEFGVLSCLPPLLDELAVQNNVPGLADFADQVRPNATLQQRYIETSSAANPVIGVGPHCQGQVPFFTGQVPDGDDLVVRMATDPFRPGQDFRGVESDLIRLALIADWDLDRVTFSSFTGYTRDDNFESLDQGKFALPVGADFPFLSDRNFRDANINTFLFENEKLTQQYSQELRMQTRFDGPLNLTIGGLWWREDLENWANSHPMNAGASYCFYNSVLGQEFPAFFPAPGCPGWTERPIQDLIYGGFEFGIGDGSVFEGIQQFRDPHLIARDTNHRSIYGMIEFDVSPTIQLIAEGRYSYETVDVTGPRFLFPGATGGAGGQVFCGTPGRPCDDAFLFGPSGPFWSDANFRQAYNLWNPANNTVGGAALSGAFAGQQLVDLIPDVCRNDPQVQQRIADAEQGIDTQFDFFNPFCEETISRTDKWFSPKLTLSWKPSQESLLYTSWARAEKPGGFSTLTIGASGLVRDLAEFEPERMDVYEIGGNVSLFDRTVRLNGAAFFQDFTDKQVLVQALAPDGRAVSRIENASSAEVWGFEVEGLWQPLRQVLGGDWSLQLAYTFLNGKYTDFGDPTFSESSIALAGNCVQAEIVGEGGTVRPACDVNFGGNRLERSPRHSIVNNISYRRPLVNDMDLLVSVDNQWTDKRFLEFTNENSLAAYWNTDLQLGVTSPRWEVLAYVTNLFEDNTVRSASSSPGLSCCFQLGIAVDIAGPMGSAGSGAEVPVPKWAFLPPPRVIGVRASYRFGAAGF